MTHTSPSPARTPAGGSTTGPLQGVRVVEMGSLIAGPFCGQLLGDFGADVIKVEDPATGDPMRQWMLDDATGESLWWPVIARNKQSVTVDLRTSQGQDVVRRLIATADVLVENFRPGTLERWGLGYDVLARDNPGLVMTRVTGYGQDGPYSGRAGFGSIGEAMGGLRYVTGDPATPPSRVGISIGDSLAGLFSALGTSMALVARGRTGRGQVVDTAIYEAVLAVMEALVPLYQHSGVVRERTGSILPGVAPSNVYPTSDGDSILIGANRDTVFERLVAVMDRADLLPELATHDARAARQQELDEVIAAWTYGRPTDVLLKDLHEAGVPAGRLFTARDMLADEHFAARRALSTLMHRTLGEFTQQSPVPQLSETPGSLRWLGPDLGEHTESVLTELLGMTSAEIRELVDRGVV